MNNVLGFFKDKNIRHVQKGSDLLVSCFNKRDHKRGDQNPSLGVDSETGVFYCWSCHVRGVFPQLIAAYGYINEVQHYAPGTPKRQRIIYDIDSLKSGEGISIPGIGRFLEKHADKSLENSRKYLESRKITLGEHEKQISQKILQGSDSIQDRVDYFSRVEGDLGKSDFVLPDQLVRAKHVEYFSERGLPTNFCDHQEVYLCDKELKLPAYSSFLSPRYFYIPIRGVLGNLKSVMGVSFDKKTEPRMYHIGPPISFPVLDLDKIKFDKDLYVVEGWLDHYKLQTLGYNSLPTFSNIFGTIHFTVTNRVTANVYFVFDQDVAGYKMLQNVLNYVSRTTTNWYAVFLPHTRFKDVGDIDLLDIPLELGKAVKYPLYQIKKYLIMLGAEKYNGSKEVLNSDRYTFRGDSLYQEFGAEHFGSGDQDSAEQGPRIWEELPVEKKRENESRSPWGLVPV